MPNNKKALGPKLHISELGVYTYVFLAALAVMAPFIFMILGSFKSNNELNRIPPAFFPESLRFDNFKFVWERMRFPILFRNSLFLSVLKTAIQLYTSTLGGYVFSKIEFRGRNALFASILATMAIPWPVTIIPMYQQMLWFGWVNSYVSIVVPFIYNAFGIFMMRQFISGIPDSIIESGRIDGAKEFRIFHQLVFPLLGPGISALGIFIFLGNWDDFLWPLLMLNDPNKLTLPVGMQSFHGTYWDNYAGLITSATMAVIPVIIVYFIFQKQFIEGIALQGIKG